MALFLYNDIWILPEIWKHSEIESNLDLVFSQVFLHCYNSFTEEAEQWTDIFYLKAFFMQLSEETGDTLEKGDKQLPTSYHGWPTTGKSCFKTGGKRQNHSFAVLGKVLALRIC